MEPGELVRLARARGLAALAVTDHDTFRGASLAARASRVLGGPVIVPGNEVRTEYGDVLVLCPELHPRAPRRLASLREWATMNNCVLIAAHPYHPVRSSIGPRVSRLLGYFDAIEVWNSRGLPFFNAPALLLHQRSGKPATSGSDAHVPGELATSPVVLPDEPRSPGDVVEWIRRGLVEYTAGLPRPWVLPSILAWAIERRLAGDGVAAEAGEAVLH